MKQQLAAIRMRFDWLITGQILPYSFARIGAALKMKVEDHRPKGAGWKASAA